MRASQFLLVPLLLLAFPAHADNDVTKLIQRLNKKAMEDYDALEFDSARQTLQSAIAKLREAALDETPLASKVYINLGIVFLAGKDHHRGVQQFVSALKIDAQAAIDPEQATPELQEAFEEARKQLRPAKRPATPPTPPTKEPPPALEDPVDSGDGSGGLRHTPIDEGRAGSDVPIKAHLGVGFGPARLFLLYRAGGQEEYVSVPMVREPRGAWSATIPGIAMTGRAIHYYIEARDAKGKALVAAGSAASPNIISVVGGTPEKGADDENPLGKPTDKRSPPGAGRGFGRLFLRVMGGSGAGIIPAHNHTEVAYQFQTESSTFVPQPIGATGFAIAPLHLTFELGVAATEQIGLSLLGRIGATLVNNADSSANPPLGGGTTKADADWAGLLRFTYRFGQGRIHPLAHAGLGLGVVRHVLDIRNAQSPEHPLADSTTAQAYPKGTPNPNSPVNEVCPDHNKCVDTVAMGALLVSAGGGLFIDLAQFHNGGFGLFIDLDTIFALPVGIDVIIQDAQFGVNFDLNLGLGVHFL